MLLNFINVSFAYERGKKKTFRALDSIDLTVNSGEFICITGPTGSGKSTLVQHMNGLLKPNEGTVLFKGKEISYRGDDLQKLRKSVGLVFQFPEDQLFEETIAKDIAFGPRKLGMPKGLIEERVKEIMHLVGLPYEDFKDHSPMKISGGQKRRAAIAGVLITDPEILILDEPTAGLDPKGKKEIMTIARMVQQKGSTVIMITHDLELIAEYASRVVVMDKGRIVGDAKAEAILTNEEMLTKIKMLAPEPFQIARDLRRRGWNLQEKIYDWDSLAEDIIKVWNAQRRK
ncbi:MAG: energy-coupling factor transporter ATPase [Bacillota bacterium]